MRKLSILVPLFLFALTAISVPALLAQENEEEEDCTAYIAGIVGKCEYRESDDEDWKPAELDMCLYVGDQVRTQKESALALKIGENVETRVNQLSLFTVRSVNPKEQNPNQIDLSKGEVWAKALKKEDTVFQVKTPAALAGVRGTEFNVAVDEEGKSSVHVLDGVVDVFNEFGKVLAEAGFSTEVLKGKIPLDPSKFDIDSYKQKLDEWKDQISIGKVKEALQKKVEEIKDNVKEKSNVDSIKGKIKKPKF